MELGTVSQEVAPAAEGNTLDFLTKGLDQRVGVRDRDMYFLIQYRHGGTNSIFHTINTPVGRLTFIIYFIRVICGAQGNGREAAEHAYEGSRDF